MLDFPHRAPQRLPGHGCYIAFQAYRGERFYHVFQARRAVPSPLGAITRLAFADNGANSRLLPGQKALAEFPRPLRVAF